MPSRAPGPAQRTANRRAARRVRRFAALAALAAVVLLTLLLTAFGSSGSPIATRTTLAPANRLLPSGQPDPLVVAVQGALRIQLPIEQSRVTAIGYHAGGPAALALQPVGRRGNEGVLGRVLHRIFGGGDSRIVWYQLSGGEGPRTSALDVGAAPGTDVYAPVDGTVVGVSDYVVDGEKHGVEIDIRPLAAPSTILSVTRLRADPAVTVGYSVAAGSTRLGTVIDLSKLERQALARFTQDAGNHVTLLTQPASAIALR